MNEFMLVFFYFQVKKVVKTTTTRTVIPSVSDTLSLDGGGSVTGGYTAPMVYRQGPGGGVPMEYPTHTVPRNYHYGPPMGYEDYRGPPSEAYASLTRGARMDERYRYRSFKITSSPDERSKSTITSSFNV